MPPYDPQNSATSYIFVNIVVDCLIVEYPIDIYLTYFGFLSNLQESFNLRLNYARAENCLTSKGMF